MVVKEEELLDLLSGEDSDGHELLMLYCGLVGGIVVEGLCRRLYLGVDGRIIE